MMKKAEIPLLLSFADNEFDSPWKSRQHLLTKLTDRCDIVYVESPRRREGSKPAKPRQRESHGLTIIRQHVLLDSRG